MSYPQLFTPEEKLADAKARLGIPKIVVICGSTRFMDEMTAADCELTWAGHIVVKPGCNMKIADRLWADDAEAEAGKVRLDELHRAKIRLADEVLVVGDYIGSSTTAEIEYARSLGKSVTFTHPSVDPEAGVVVTVHGARDMSPEAREATEALIAVAKKQITEEQ
ncbi:hypothetical protein [Streptomyces luteocolor]|uniref:hypothetical protein n=1 Tax=Streptomyces luteocolor TaxID=285500 RepID=UPI000ACCB5C7|nr:hypothetical protein [Streptomyces luteocolor]